MDKEEFLKGEIFSKYPKKELDKIAKELHCQTEFNKRYKEKFKDFNEIFFGENAPVQRLKGGEYKIRESNGVQSIYNYNDKIVCFGLIEPIAIYENILNGKEIIKLAYLKDNRWKTILVSQEKIANAGKLTELANYGIPVSSATSSNLSKFLVDIIAINRNILEHGKSTSKMGWIDNKFIPYDEDIIFDGEESFKKAFESIEEKGNYETWLECMKYVRKKTTARLLMAASFASPILKILRKKPFITLLWGTSGDGKTVAGMCALSVWGNPLEGHLQFSMNNTDNYYYRIAEFMNNLPCFFDELQTFKGDLDKLLMMLAEGMDRGRATKDGGIESLKIWQNTFILTGEQTASTFNSGGGTLNRLIEINTNGKVIEQGSRVARIVSNNYGYAGKIFIDYISKMKEEKIEKIYEKNLELLLENKDTEEKQAQNMAILLTADDIARECIFKEDEKIKIEDILEYMFTKQEIDISERAWEYVYNELSININKFTENDREVWGALSFNNYELDVNKNVLDKILKNGGFNPNKTYKDWYHKGKLIRDEGTNRTASSKSIKGFKCYYVHLKMALKQEG